MISTDPHVFVKHESDWLDQHIWPQIQCMMAHDAYFKLMGYAQKLIGRFNGPIGWLIEIGYVSYQLTAIRRLCDSGRDVISLRKLLEKAKSNPLVPRAEIVQLSPKLAPCNHVCNMANNYVAHIANPLRGKNSKNLNPWDLQVPDLTEAQKAVCVVAATLERVLQRSNHVEIMPVPQYDIMQEFRSWVPEDRIQELWKYWHTRRGIVNAWIVGEVL